MSTINRWDVEYFLDRAAEFHNQQYISEKDLKTIGSIVAVVKARVLQEEANREEEEKKKEEAEKVQEEMN